MNYKKLTIYLLMIMIIALCCYLINLIVKLDDDSSRFTNYVVLSCSGIFICLMIGEAYIIQYKPKSRHLQTIRTILLILAILVLLYIAINQIAHSLLDDNGSGKVPIIDPHDADWYRLKKIARIIEYTTCTLVAIIQIIIGYKKKRKNVLLLMKNEQNNIKNDQLVITSLEQVQDNNSINQSLNNSHMINTLDSKNTKQQQAIYNLQNNNNNNNS